MFIATAWEMFYTDSDRGIDYVNQISIDSRNNRFILDEDVSDLATDGLDDCGNEISSYYVSRVIFEMLVKGVKERGFKEYRFSEE